jgi:protease-3
MRMAQVSAETINPAHPGSRFSGGNLETLSDKPNSPVLMPCTRFAINTTPPT